LDCTDDNCSRVLIGAHHDQVIGTSVMVSGSGTDDEVDRENIRNKLSEFLRRETKSSFVIEKITVYCPNIVLEMGLCIVDVPGTDDCDPINYITTENAVHEANSLIIMVSRGMDSSMATVKMMEKCSVIDRTLEGKLDLTIVSNLSKGFDQDFQDICKPEIKRLKSLEKEKKKMDKSENFIDASRKGDI
jgi:hypothetical protein